MHAQNATATVQQPHFDTTGLRKRVLTLVLFVLVQMSILFGLAGRLDWDAGWAYFIIFLAAGVVNAALVIAKHPDLIAERAQIGANAKSWDKALVLLVGLTLPLMTLGLSGLDRRYGWTIGLSNSVQVGGLIVTVLGFSMVSWALAHNRFFSGVVRIQTDRGHEVATGGPYSIVRHPGYVGMITFNLGIPLLLGSLVALVSAAVTALLFILRTALEDRTLQQELPGYTEYASRVRYRLLPGLW